MIQAGETHSVLTSSTSTNQFSNPNSYYYTKRNVIKSQRISEEFQYVPLTQILMISHCGLTQIPEEEFQKIDEEAIQRLRRFDISHNFIQTIPSYILNTMTNLREIWLNNNPMTQFPHELLSLPLLETIDIHNTKISEIPLEIVELKQLVTFDWRNTPLTTTLFTTYFIEENDLSTLREIFQDLYTRKLTRKNLYEYLYGEFYLQDADKSYAAITILGFIEELSNVFDDLEDFVSFSHRPGNFIPTKVDQLIQLTFVKAANTAKELFYKMKRDTDRKRLAADVEIKIRGMYFDRIERSEVVTLIDSIYANVHSLEDMQFLVQYATKVLPPEVPDATGERVWQNILDLQDELIRKREASVVALSNSLSQMYPEQKPETLLGTAREIAASFQIERFATEKELLRMTQLTADASKVFPPDFAAIIPQDVLAKAHEVIFKNLK